MPYMTTRDLDAWASTLPEPALLRKRFTRAALEATREAGRTAGFVPTSHEMVCAEVMREAAKYQAQDMPFSLQFPANLRGRYRNLPDAYFGSAVVLCVTEPMPAGSVAKADVAVLAPMIRAAKERWTSSAEVDAVLGWEVARDVRPRHFPESDGAHMVLTNWTSFPFFAVTLTLGTPVHVAPAYTMWVPNLGHILATAPSTDRAADVIFCLPEPVQANSETAP